MKINLTLVFSIILAMGIVTTGYTFLQSSRERERIRQDLMDRSSQVVEDLDTLLNRPADTVDTTGLIHYAQTLSRKYRLTGIAVYLTPDSLLFATSGTGQNLLHSKENLQEAFASDTVIGAFISKGDARLFQYISPVGESGNASRVILVCTDAASAGKAIRDIWLRNLIRWSIQSVLVAIITILILRWGIFTPLNQLVSWMKSARIGTIDPSKHKFPYRFLASLHSEAAHLAEAMTEARATAEEEVLLRTHGEAIWTPARLAAEAKMILKDRVLIVVSNREPYMHIQEGRSIRYIVPASGMVTAMEPILEACGGLWVASGSGDADRQVVDEHDKITVPPDDPKYTLRRIWVSQEEEEHYYYGFSNEGLWPLCHVAHTRPVFRTEDWKYYWEVNRKFADTILEEIRLEKQPFILVQDYHFSLLPAMIKKSRPDARVSIFWHIPWPNPESFGICPWQREILKGMLGADLIGFHTQYHCNNFLSTVNRALEARVAWETFSVTISNHTTRVKPFPISISFTMKDYNQEEETADTASLLLKNSGITTTLMGVGVDRIDYTKGILERFHAIERFFEKYPSYQGMFTFVQIGAPSRTFLRSYSDLVQATEQESERINRKFQSQGWKPILFLSRHHSHQEIAPYYSAASLCLVTSLHDGMNLVAKEFVASRNDRKGVLILSRFTGAAQELAGALIVNPYDIEEMADAIKTALDMPAEEQQLRMSQMRQTILRHNVYSWAASFLKGLE